jgi:hypothetical protein
MQPEARKDEDGQSEEEEEEEEEDGKGRRLGQSEKEEEFGRWLCIYRKLTTSTPLCPCAGGKCSFLQKKIASKYKTYFLFDSDE